MFPALIASCGDSNSGCSTTAGARLDVENFSRRNHDVLFLFRTPNREVNAARVFFPTTLLFIQAGHAEE